MTDIGIPYAALLFLPAFSYEDLEKAEVELMKIDGVAVKYSMVSQIILGNLCYRLFDNNYSDQKRFLVERYKYQPETKIEY